MYYWENNHNLMTNIRVTDNHMMVGWNRHFKRYDFRQARDIGKIAWSLPTTGKWEPDINLDSPIKNISLKLYAQFMGIYLSEGSLGIQPSPNGGSHYNISIWQKRNNKQIAKILDLMPCKFSRYKGFWGAASKDICIYLKQFGLSGHKYVPQEIKQSSPKIINEFLRYYEIGDGSKNKNNGWYALVTTKSKRMADDLQELYIKAGISARVKYISRKLGNYYEVRKHKNYRPSLKPKYLSIEDVVNEDVYCVTVPNHTVMVRRNSGRAVFCGNCVITKLNEFDQWIWMKCILGQDEGIYDFGLRVKRFCQSEYPGARWIDAGDPAGKQKSDKSEQTSVQILMSMGIAVNSRKQEIKLGIEIIRKRFDIRADGKPGILVNPQETLFIDMAKGGLHYPDVEKEGQQKEYYEKDGIYDHIGDSLRYIAVEMFDVTGSQLIENEITQRQATTSHNQFSMGGMSSDENNYGSNIDDLADFF